MNFYRKATIQDIQISKSKFEDYLPQEVIDLVHSVDNRERLRSASVLNRNKNVGIERCKDIIREYDSILRAEQDLINGEIIYTDYYNQS